jgi:hypothetical protein
VKLALAQFILNGPADAVMDPDWGRIRSASEGMTLQTYGIAGRTTSAMWVDSKGSPHNPYGPAAIWLWPSGNIRILEYLIEGFLHRDRAVGPAKIHYDESGNITYQQFTVCPWL